jgi:RHS repeat-associated protein
VVCRFQISQSTEDDDYARRKIMKLHSWLAAMFIIVGTGVSSGQVATGTPPFGSFGGGPFDILNLGNLNVHFAIPVVNKTGRGLPFAYNLSYDSSIWTPVTSSGVTTWQPDSNWGWIPQTDASLGRVTESTTNIPCLNPLYPPGLKYLPGPFYTNYAYRDSFNVAHPFNIQVKLGACGQTSPLPATAVATDGSGYTISTSGLGGTITARTGKVINPTTSAEDTNGNEITLNSNGQFFDTLSSTTPVLTVAGSGTPSSPFTFKYTNPSGTTSTYTMNYLQYTVQTAFGVSGVNEYGPLSNALVSSIQLADGSSYSFTYEAGPSSCTPCVTGRIKQVTLPTGGTITYTYTGGSNGIESDGSTAGLTRVLSPGGTWQYSRALSGSTSTTTITDPTSQQNQTVINFAKDSTTGNGATYNFYETERWVYKGSSASGTLLLTLLTCYNGNITTSCGTATVSSPITDWFVFREVPNGSSTKTSALRTSYNSYGLPTNQYTYDYGLTPGQPPSGLLLSQLITTYATLGNNIVDHPYQITLQDGQGNIKSKTTYTYDQGSITTTSGTPQHVSISGSRGNPTTISSLTSGSSTLSQQFTYYDTGNVNTSTDVNAGVTSYKYGDCGNSFLTETDLPPASTGATPMKTYLTWDSGCAGGVVTQSEDPNGNPTNYKYLDANYWRVTETSFPDGGSTSTTYNFGTNSPWNITTSSAKTSSTNVTGKTVLDGFGRVVETQATSDPSGNVDYVDTVYDSVGRLASVSNPYQTHSDPTYGITQYSYDPLNRSTAVIHPDNTQATFTYTGAATETVDEGNNSGGSTQVSKVYQGDGMGRLISVCEVSTKNQLGSSGNYGACGQDIALNGFLTSYGYDPLGNITSVTQGSVSRSYSFDGLSRLTQEVNPETGTTAYAYDTATAGDIYQRTRPKPNQTGTATVVTTYTFDKLHRMTGTSYNDGSTPPVAVSYDQSSEWGVNLTNYLGQPTLAVAANGYAGTVFSYDTMGRVTEDWQCTPLTCGISTVSLAFSYDYLGDVTSLANSNEGATYTYSYDTLARLTKLQSSLSDSNHPGTLLTVNTYNPLGEVTQATLGNGIVRNMGYDNRGRQTSLTDGSIYNFGLGYAGDSNIVTGNDSINGNWTYTYDDFNRLSASNKNSGAQTFTYAYDRYANRWQQNAPQGGPAPQYSFNGNNQITGSSVTYDAAGNVTNDGLGNSYTYDAENRLTAVTGTNSATYVYDALGQRVRSTINSTPYDFIYNGGHPVDEITASSWVWGDAGALQLAAYANSTTYFKHNDWLGTVRAWSNVSGGSIGTCVSLPFGDAQTCTGTSPTPAHYTGLPQDSESGLTHALFRQMSTTEGRWTAPDPAGLAAVDPTNPQSWNRYAYSNNSPLVFVDPNGLAGLCVESENHEHMLTLAFISYDEDLMQGCGDTLGGGGGDCMLDFGAIPCDSPFINPEATVVCASNTNCQPSEDGTGNRIIVPPGAVLVDGGCFGCIILTPFGFGNCYFVLAQPCGAAQGPVGNSISAANNGTPQTPPQTPKQQCVAQAQQTFNNTMNSINNQSIWPSVIEGTSFGTLAGAAWGCFNSTFAYAMCQETWGGSALVTAVNGGISGGGAGATKWFLKQAGAMSNAQNAFTQQVNNVCSKLPG